MDIPPSDITRFARTSCQGTKTPTTSSEACGVLGLMPIFTIPQALTSTKLYANALACGDMSETSLPPHNTSSGGSQKTKLIPDDFMNEYHVYEAVRGIPKTRMFAKTDQVAVLVIQILGVSDVVTFVMVRQWAMRTHHIRTV